MSSNHHRDPGSMHCNELVELVTEYLEGAMPQAASARLESHLAECPGCAEYVEQIRTAVRVAGGIEPPVSAGDADRLLEIFREWKEQARSTTE